jgi:hypothetical protein
MVARVRGRHLMVAGEARHERRTRTGDEPAAAGNEQNGETRDTSHPLQV